jgi:hypothetical protein
VLCGIDRYVEEDFKKLMYVGCSRARSYLAVLLTATAQRAASQPRTGTTFARRNLPAPFELPIALLLSV